MVQTLSPSYQKHFYQVKAYLEQNVCVNEAQVVFLPENPYTTICRNRERNAEQKGHKKYFSMTRYFSVKGTETPRGNMTFLGWQNVLGEPWWETMSPQPRAGTPPTPQEIIYLN